MSLRIDARKPVSTPPSGTITDGDIENMSLIIGGNLEDGRGNVTAYATYINIKAVTQSERDYSCLRAGWRTDGVRRLRHQRDRYVLI